MCFVGSALCWLETEVIDHYYGLIKGAIQDPKTRLFLIPNNFASLPELGITIGNTQLLIRPPTESLVVHSEYFVGPVQSKSLLKKDMPNILGRVSSSLIVTLLFTTTSRLH